MITTELRAARERAGWNQGELADRLSTSQPAVSFIESGRRVPRYDTVERWLRQTGHQLVVYPSVHPSAPESGAAIAAALDDGDRDRAWRHLIDYSDGLSASEPVECVILAAGRPPLTGRAEWDAAIAAVTDYRVASRGLPIPPWAEEPERFVGAPTALVISDFDVAPDRAEVPVAFSRRNVLVEAGALRSV